jgi:phenylacetate-CoA ligase
MAFPSYLRHLALVARDELGIDPRSLGVRLLCSHLGVEDREAIEELWGAPCFDSYGTHENGTIASECQARDGMHVMEDAILTEIVDPETGRHAEKGAKGIIHITTLYRNSAPQIRFNINDVASHLDGPCPCGCTFRRMSKIFGRNDNMIKVRGVNVFTEAVGEVVAKEKRSNGEFFCIVERVGQSETDELTVMVEALDLGGTSELKYALEERLKEVIGLRTTVTPVGKGELDKHTGLSQTSKIKRLLDKRSAS